MQPICYLCGDPIEGEPSVDHVPPKQFFASSIRRQENLDRLTTFSTHESCNHAYGRDEEYATAILALAAERSDTGLPLIEQLVDKFNAGESVGLGYRILEQFNERPSGLYLPGDLITMEVEGDRISRVLWKIVRGLYWQMHNEVLPEDTPYTLEIFEPVVEENPRHPEIWEAVKAQSSQGVYGAVFDYKYLHAVAGAAELHAWGMLLWNRVMVFVAHPPIGAEHPVIT